MGEPGSEPWFEAAFRASYLEVYPHRDVASARREVAHLVAGGLESPLLDLGCGQGRHSLALCEAGLRVFGVDLSAELLARAGDLGPGAEVLAGRLARADQRAIPFRDASLATVTMLFSSFGYFDDAGNAGVLAELARVLRPGGRAVLDLMNPARIRAGLVPESRTERDGLVLLESRRLEAGGSRVVKDVRMSLGGRELSWREDVRLYDPPEVQELVAGAGFRLERVEGDFDGSPRTDASPRQILWIRR